MGLEPSSSAKAHHDSTRLRLANHSDCIVFNSLPPVWASEQMKEMMTGVGTKLARAILTLLSAAGGLAGLPSSAFADLTACNKTSYVLEAAVGFVARERDVSRGWIQIEPGQCRVLIEGTLADRTYYTFAHSSPVHTGEMKYFAGTERFCTETGAQNFNVTGRSDCETRGFVTRTFARIDTNGNSDWTTSFTEAKEFSLDEARIAGVQRLLKDIGASDAPIDGFRGGKTNRAVIAFKRKSGLTEDATLPSALYAALMKTAGTMPKQAGFRFCNQTDQTAWGAVGYEGASDATSTGWFTIPAHGCTDAIKERLRAKFYYSYAESERKNGGLMTWGGDDKFCTAEERFVIRGREGCEKRGYTTRGFMRVDTKGQGELTQTLTSEGALSKRAGSP